MGIRGKRHSESQRNGSAGVKNGILMNSKRLQILKAKKEENELGITFDVFDSNLLKRDVQSKDFGTDDEIPERAKRYNAKQTSTLPLKDPGTTSVQEVQTSFRISIKDSHDFKQALEMNE